MLMPDLTYLAGGNFMLGVDMSNGTDESCITVGQQKGDKYVIINTLYGSKAEIVYHSLIGKGNSLNPSRIMSCASFEDLIQEIDRLIGKEDI